MQGSSFKATFIPWKLSLQSRNSHFYSVLLKQVLCSVCFDSTSNVEVFCTWNVLSACITCLKLSLARLILHRRCWRLIPTRHGKWLYTRFMTRFTYGNNHKSTVCQSSFGDSTTAVIELKNLSRIFRDRLKFASNNVFVYQTVVTRMNSISYTTSQNVRRKLKS